MSWSEIKKAVNSDLNKPLDTLIKELLTDTAKETSVDEVESLLKNNDYGLNAIKTAMGSSSGGCIKSIQRGTISSGTSISKEFDWSDSNYSYYVGYVDITLNTVSSLNKTIAIGGYRSANGFLNVNLLSTSILRCYVIPSFTISSQIPSKTTSKYHWIVIEFY